MRERSQMRPRPLIALLLILATTQPAVAGPILDALFDELRATGAGPFDPTRGETLWNRDDVHPREQRACATCHGSDLTGVGTHARTRKTIEPLAPSVNPLRLTRRSEIDKWLLRNCKWTFGRECTAQEKGDLLTFIQNN